MRVANWEARRRGGLLRGASQSPLTGGAPQRVQLGAAEAERLARERVRGYVDAIDARDIDDAIRAASRIPPARLGSIEIRPVRELPVPPERPSSV